MPAPGDETRDRFLSRGNRMTSPLIRKLEGYAGLSDDDRRLLDGVSQDARTVPGRTDLIREGDKPTDVYLILEGFACRYKITSDGKRQIMAYLVPGNLCDLRVFVLEQMDHSIGTLTPSKLAFVRPSTRPAYDFSAPLSKT